MKINKKYDYYCNCSHVDAKKPTDEKTELSYSFYSNVLNKPFKSLSELTAAEQVYYNELKVKEDKAAQKKADAKKVEDAFKALNAARKDYKEDLTILTKQYTEDLLELKKRFETYCNEIKTNLADAEDAYSKALTEFTDKYQTYHLSLKDGDFETTISGQNATKADASADFKRLSDLFDLFFRF